MANKGKQEHKSTPRKDFLGYKNTRYLTQNEETMLGIYGNTEYLVRKL